MNEAKDLLSWVIKTKNTERLDVEDIDDVYEEYKREKCRHRRKEQQESGKVIDLIEEAINNGDKRVCELFLEDPLFRQAYNVLCETRRSNPEKMPEAIFGIIVSACKQKRETMKKLIKKMQEAEQESSPVDIAVPIATGIAYPMFSNSCTEDQRNNCIKFYKEHFAKNYVCPECKKLFFTLNPEVDTTILDALIKEAKAMFKEHPSKDARFFAKSVYNFLTRR